MSEGLQRFADTITQQAAGRLERTVSRRSFLVRMTVVGSALTIAPLRYLLRPGNAWANNSNCTTCTMGECLTSPNSTFCCSLSGGSNACPSGTDACGWWQCCVPTLYCSSGTRYFVDCCDPNCGSPHCANGHCDSRVTCCFPAEWKNCNTMHGTIKCRVVLCVPPGVAGYGCDPPPGPTQATCCQGSTALPCPNFPSCCDTCSPC
jgi:hypothetical protein